MKHSKGFICMALTTVALAIAAKADDSFWSIVKRGADDAGKLVAAQGGSVTWLGPQNYDNLGADAANLIRNAISQGADAIVAPNWVTEAMDEAFLAVVAAGIPLVICNAGGIEAADRLGAMNYVGSDDYLAGVAAGEYFAAHGQTNLVCVNTLPGAANLEAQCNGLNDGVTGKGGTSKQLPLPSSSFGDATAVTQAVASYLQTNTDVTGVYTIGNMDAVSASTAIAQAGAGDRVKLGSMNMDQNILENIKAGTQLFAVAGLTLDLVLFGPETECREMTAPILQLTNVNKSFGPIDVLFDINLDVYPGEVLCLLGDNSAGKSTLIKLISGEFRPSSGTITMNGQQVDFASPRDGSNAGIATVHQFGGTFPLMSIGRSFFVGQEPTQGWGLFKRFDRKTANDIAVQAVRELGINRITDGDRLVGGLSTGERQALAIARAVHFGANVLILDEPTAALGVKEAAHVMRIVMQARKKGIAVIFITHNVIHALTVGDHFAVLIKGAKAADFRKGEKTRAEITDLMAGGEQIAELEAEIDSNMQTHDGHPPRVA